ncbi:hypothetical protein RHMOL_Rhmol02G0285300 [Rhododendron molle]|uniref:Uncharacterized protein n=1 Tax=Rhododendron molle TaxID=49168 RepID=A0ACC0PWH9_RHOML|nr:hypothetical protein RHMOL_Rhmol02G0285300 [Rhododendron molle]
MTEEIKSLIRSKFLSPLFIRSRVCGLAVLPYCNTGLFPEAEIIQPPPPSSPPPPPSSPPPPRPSLPAAGDSGELLVDIASEEEDKKPDIDDPL